MVASHRKLARCRHYGPALIAVKLVLAGVVVLCGQALKCFVLPVVVSKVVRPPHGQRIRGGLLTACAARSENADDANNDEVSKELRLAQERLTKIWNEGGGSTATSFSVSPSGANWTVDRLQISEGLPPAGSVLLADPRGFFLEDGGPAALRTGRLPFAEGSRRDKANLPVVLLTRVGRGFAEGLLLGLWTGKLMGDIGVEDFMTRPLYHGGPGANGTGLSMVHSYPEMPGSTVLSADGLAWSNHYETACRWIHTGPGSSLRFKFFYHSILWEGDEVDELSSTAGVWIPVQVSRDYLLREPDSSLEEPLWVQYAHKAGGELAELAKEFGLLP